MSDRIIKIFGLFITLGLIVGVIYFSLFLYEDKGREVISELKLEGNHLLESNKYLKFAMLQDSSEYEFLSLNEIKKKFIDHSYIKDVKLETNGKGTVIVTITEKDLFAFILAGNESYFITHNYGVLPVIPGTEFSDLPVITNIKNSKEINENTFCKSEDMVQAFRIINAAKVVDRKLALKLSEINLKNGGDVIITFSEQLCPVLFGRKNEIVKMLALKELKTDLKLNSLTGESKYIDLRFSNSAFLGQSDNTGSNG